MTKVATLTTYVDQQGITLLVAAALRGGVRLFPVDCDPMRRRFTERAQREAGERAKAWAAEMGAPAQREVRVQLPLADGRDAAALLAMVQQDVLAMARRLGA
jgi:hypothetical protein